MAVEPYTVAAFVVSTASMITAGAATFAARYVRQARDNSDKALRVLTGEKGVQDRGLVDDVRAHRRALLAIDAYPPVERSGEREPGSEPDLSTDGGQRRD